MKRIYGSYAYGPGPRGTCFWDESAALFEWPQQNGDMTADLCVIGAGFTGVNAALTAARGGSDVVVLEAETPGWGASGRNGGFCCLGGAIHDKAKLKQRYGAEAEARFYAAEKASIDHVAGLLRTHSIDADVHSDGETYLAHKPSRMAELEAHGRAFEETFGGTASYARSPTELADEGMAGPFHGGVTTRLGFALNPRKYIDGILRVALDAGIRIFARSPAIGMSREAGIWRVKTANGVVSADKVLIATNGYSSEDLPAWMAGRYMPTQSTVIVTRPLTGDEIQKQGWTSHQMSYDTRHLLHYFRLMPNNRFLIGMRGGLMSSARSEAAARARVRASFAKLFPAWSDVDITHEWSGMVCLSPKFAPFAGEIPGHPGLLAGFAYHGNGVAMGSYTGHLLGQFALGADDAHIPEVMRSSPGRFPFGRGRRILMPPAYAKFWLQDL